MTPNMSSTCAVCYDPIAPDAPTLMERQPSGEMRAIHEWCATKKPESVTTMVAKPKRYCGASRNG